MTDRRESPRFILPYVGTIGQWAMMSAGHFVIEAHDRYERRTQRTRTAILGSHGPVELSVPIRTRSGQLYRETELNYETDWQRQHFYALQTAYHSSAYFDLMEEDFRRVYSEKYELLWDFNMALMRLIEYELGLRLDYTLSAQGGAVGEGEIDMRNAITPRHTNLIDGRLRAVEYTQVFSSPYTENAFTPWLSVYDLLFNMGQEGRIVLRQMTTGLQ
ncbi:MAG: WbqC family protein [Bacteroidales bacterium]|nr:WbqC family protein [Bacteroidales bacterium]